MGVKITQNLNKKINASGREWVSQMADLGLKICQKMPFLG